MVYTEKRWEETLGPRAPAGRRNGESMAQERAREDSYRVLARGGQGEITEKKSRFIATLRPVEREEEAAAFVEEIRKKYWDARHNCFAYVLGSRGELARCSDDGEPGGTAGRPMLEVLTGEGIRNAAVVVTRYFGGVLLGTGGLARAYSQAVQEGLKACRVAVMRYGWQISLKAGYGDVGKILYLLGQRGIAPRESQYGAEVRLEIFAAAGEAPGLIQELTEATGGRMAWTRERELYFME